MSYAEDRERGRRAALAGQPFDPRESVGWEHGYGDALVIEQLDGPPPDEEPDV